MNEIKSSLFIIFYMQQKFCIPEGSASQSSFTIFISYL